MEKKIEKESSLNEEKLEGSETNDNLNDQNSSENPSKEDRKNKEEVVKDADLFIEKDLEQPEIVDKHEKEKIQTIDQNSDNSKKNQNDELKSSIIEDVDESSAEILTEEVETKDMDISVNTIELNVEHNTIVETNKTKSDKIESDEKVKVDLSASGEPEDKNKELVSDQTPGEKPNTENPEKEGPIEEHHLDYSNYSKKQMVQVLESLQKENNFNQIGKILKEIKKAFDPIVKVERKAAYEKYVADGGEKDGFEYRFDELDQRYQNAFNNLRERKNQYYNGLEKQKEQNLIIKLEIIEKLRVLVDSEETGSSIKIIKDLQSEWKDVGVISYSQGKSLWANYNALLDRYYDQRSIYFELKELDRKKNYNLKIELCKKAESLSEEENIREAIKHLNELHEEFKHIGPVPKVEQEVIWERFKSASDKIYLKRKAFYEKLKDEHKINEIAKEVLIEKVIPFTEFSSDKISDWNTKTKEILSIQKEWEAIGSMSKEKAKIINKQFWVSFKSFFNKKGQFFKKLEEWRKENLVLKQQLVNKAEALKESEDFKKTSEEFKQLQRQWKEIGPVSEKFRNEIFFKFKKACDYFFDRRRENSGTVDKDYEENLKKKQILCDEIESMINAEKIEIDRIKNIEVEWVEIGFVPKSSMKFIQEKYLNLINRVTENIDISESEKNKLRFSAQFNKTSNSPGAEKLIQKKEGALRRQISNLESDISLWANNIDFFASSKNADKLKEEYQLKIDNAITQLNLLKDQLKVIGNI